MKRMSRTCAVITSEIVMFIIILTIIWLDEFLDMPYLLFGATPTPRRLEEYIIETVSITIVGLLVIAGTVLLLRRLDRMERFLRVCAWCRKVWLDDHWVVFEEFVKKEYMLKSSHGICPECTHKMKADTKGGPDEKRNF
jgi:hypothetical protein